jgi:hypothetical protein
MKAMRRMPGDADYQRRGFDSLGRLMAECPDNVRAVARAGAIEHAADMLQVRAESELAPHIRLIFS